MQTANEMAAETLVRIEGRFDALAAAKLQIALTRARYVAVDFGSATTFSDASIAFLADIIRYDPRRRLRVLGLRADQEGRLKLLGIALDEAGEMVRR